MYEARQLSKFLRVRRNKTDAGDALGIAEAGRLGASLISRVHLKSLECQSLQSRLTMRRFLIRRRVATLNLLSRQIELYGGRVRRCGPWEQTRKRFEAELRKLFGRAPNPLTTEFNHLLDHCEQLIGHQQHVDRELKRLAYDNELCRRFMEIPGVGPICALSFYAAVGEPDRFKRCSDIGVYFGLTPRLYQSGLTMKKTRISKMGNKAVRTLLVQASTQFMRWSSADAALRVWASNIEQRRARGPARVALARKLATIMLAMWKSGESYRPQTVRSSDLAVIGDRAESDLGPSVARSSARVMLEPVLPTACS